MIWITEQRGTGYNHPISNIREWQHCFMINNQEILLDLADPSSDQASRKSLKLYIDCSTILRFAAISTIITHGLLTAS